MDIRGQSKNFLGLALAASLAVLSIFGWFIVSDRSAVQKQLVTNYGEIKRIDEVLTSSALMMTATGDALYQHRYDTHIDHLDQLITETIVLSDQSTARDLMVQFGRANNRLGTIEINALLASQGVPSPSAYASLLAADYIQDKKRYVARIDQTFADLCGIVDREIVWMRLAFVGSVLAFLFSGLLALRLMWSAKYENQARKSQDDQVQMMSAMIRTFMDVQNNLLNNMVYFRTKAAHNLPFDDQEVTLIDREIDLAKEKLAEIAKTDFAQTRDLGGIVVMVKDAPGQCTTPEYANVA